MHADVDRDADDELYRGDCRGAEQTFFENRKSTEIYRDAVYQQKAYTAGKKHCRVGISAPYDFQKAVSECACQKDFQ